MKNSYMPKYCSLLLNAVRFPDHLVRDYCPTGEEEIHGEVKT